LNEIAKKWGGIWGDKRITGKSVCVRFQQKHKKPSERLRSPRDLVACIEADHLKASFDFVLAHRFQCSASIQSTTLRVIQPFRAINQNKPQLMIRTPRNAITRILTKEKWFISEERAIGLSLCDGLVDERCFLRWEARLPAEEGALRYRGLEENSSEKPSQSVF